MLKKFWTIMSFVFGNNEENVTILYKPEIIKN